MKWWITDDDGMMRLSSTPQPDTYEPLPVTEWNCRCMVVPIVNTFSGNAHQRRVKRRAWLREQS